MSPHTFIEKLAEDVDRHFKPVAHCTIKFSGFEATVGGKRDVFSGEAHISAVNPDYRGPEAWVVLSTDAKGVRYELKLTEAWDTPLAFWLKKHPILAQKIDDMLRSNVGYVAPVKRGRA
jgi:hypothetical protein